MKSLGLFLALLAFSAAAAEPPPPALPQARPAVEAVAAAQAPIRVAVAEAPPVEPGLPIREVPAPPRWLLLVAGLALAGWIAHRRLSYF